MADSSLTTELVEIVRRVGKVPAERAVGSETRLVEDLGIDSLDLVAVLLAVQDRFGVDVDDEDVPSLRSIVDLAAYIENRRGSVAA